MLVQECTMLIKHKDCIASNIKAKCPSNVISFLMTKRVQNTVKRVKSFYKCAVISSNINPATVWTVQRKIEGFFKMYC